MAKKILALIGEDFEDLELTYPVLRLREEGCQVDVVGDKAGFTYHGKYGVPFVSDYAFGDVDPADYDGLALAIDKDITDEKSTRISPKGEWLTNSDLYADILTTSDGNKQSPDDYYFVSVPDLIEKFSSKHSQ